MTKYASVRPSAINYVQSAVTVHLSYWYPSPVFYKSKNLKYMPLFYG